ncbi:MAG: hypothetical protein U0L72_11745 [Acutalibacteraceae bacterium]|nr:hypothetical protein [Acutalibacteraceae bacterium]
MNNLKYYNDSLAYDFQLFMPKEKPVQTGDNIVKMPESRKNRRMAKRAASQFSVSVFSVVAAVILIGALCANLVLRIGVNELNSDINKAKSELAMKQSESVALQMEYENRISYINLEAEATALGMRKLDKNQVVYVRVNDKNMAKNGDGEILASAKE